VKQLDFRWIEFRPSFYLGVLLKSVVIIEFWLKSDKDNGQFMRKPNSVFESNSLFPTTLTIVHWGCHGKETVAIPFIHFAPVCDLNKKHRHIITV
jgi:hypothetical protein